MLAVLFARRGLLSKLSEVAQSPGFPARLIEVTILPYITLGLLLTMVLLVWADREACQKAPAA
jgi:hypothetical protein